MVVSVCAISVAAARRVYFGLFRFRILQEIGHRASPMTHELVVPGAVLIVANGQLGSHSYIRCHSSFLARHVVVVVVNYIEPSCNAPRYLNPPCITLDLWHSFD